jgi:hypothetical protein
MVKLTDTVCMLTYSFITRDGALLLLHATFQCFAAGLMCMVVTSCEYECITAENVRINSNVLGHVVM